MTDKIISSFREIENPNFNSEYDLRSWKSKAINIIIRVYGENSKQEKSIDGIKFTTYISINGAGGGNNGKHCEKEAQEIIKGFISDIANFGIPDKKETQNSGINISLNQSQNQTVNVNIIWETIKDELTGKQAKEIEEIVNGNDEPESKKNKIFEKIKSFGSDVASNIIAGILTNPSIYGG
ncbi:hypothetical protein [Chryseobacterium oryzae]|uniref:Uncharacterized protein n=1 Tax=Chryseobacterium oryzae TaxID=2929799 RepID=A0ABY4BFG7_9FLAO|nr:hypothetical protein [Chryseobacterium oryzae]UOE37007.1 hypothetical protein MTP08_07975 [Chryseobacterium oryzae]